MSSSCPAAPTRTRRPPPPQLLSPLRGRHATRTTILCSSAAATAASLFQRVQHQQHTHCTRHMVSRNGRLALLVRCVCEGGFWVAVGCRGGVAGPVGTQQRAGGSAVCAGGAHQAPCFDGGPRSQPTPKKTVKIPSWRPPEFKFPLLGGIFESPNLILTLDGTTAMVGELGTAAATQPTRIGGGFI